MEHGEKLDEGTLRELTALADGSLAPEGAAALEQRVAGSPELTDALERQRRAVGVLRSVEAPAPVRLRERIESERSQAVPPRRRWALGAGLAAAGAAAVLALVVLPSGTDPPTLAEVARLSERTPSAGAPAADPAEPKLLDVAADGVSFPNLAEKFGVRAVGRRRDGIADRRATTVYYETEDGREIAYSIVAGEALEVPDGASRAEREGVPLRYLEADERLIVTWERDGRTCVLSGEGVELDTLLGVAGWRGGGAVEV